jgi:hypothetical protein
VEERLVEALLARAEPAAADREHAATCAACARAAAELARLARALEAAAPPAPAPGLAAAALALGRLELARRRLARPRAEPLARGLPAGYARECARLLAPAVLALPLLLAWHAAVLALGERLLAGWLPPLLLAGLGSAYLAAAAGWAALVYGSIPLFAHWRTRRRGAQESP